MITFNERKRINRNMVWGIGGGVLVALINLPYRAIFDSTYIDSSYGSRLSGGLIEALPFLFIVIVVVPFLEELIFRVYIFRKLRDKFSLFWGYVGSTAAFTLCHSIPYKGGLIPNAVGSIIITYVYQKTDSLKSIWISHSIWNFMWFAVIYTFIYA